LSRVEYSRLPTYNLLFTPTSFHLVKNYIYLKNRNIKNNVLKY
jgi:hypothetical protein